MVDISSLFGVAGMNVLVTGGGRGIGEMIAEGLVANGASVIIASRDAKALEATAARLNQTHAGKGKCAAIAADLTNSKGIEALVQAVQTEFKGKLHGLVNNSGKSWGETIDTYNIPKGFEEILYLNLTAPFILTKLCLPMMEAAGTAESPARIINIGSIDGIQTPQQGTYSYSTSKMGFIALTRHLAKDLAPRNILVNLIAPGPFFTRMLASNVKSVFQNYDNPKHPDVIAFKKHVSSFNPAGRIGELSDMAGTVIFLMSKAGSYVNGCTINLDGGIVWGPKLPKQPSKL